MTQRVSLRALGEAVSAREAPPLCALARGEAQADTARGLRKSVNPRSLPSLPSSADEAPFDRAISIWGLSEEGNKCGCRILWHQHHQSTRLGPSTPELLFVQ